MPRLAETERIVEEVERRLSVSEQMEATVETNLKRTESLRQSILQRAFTGRLIAQNGGLT
jgi:type I restriction enzyme S subunit